MVRQKKANEGGYHGFWADDFSAVHVHLGSLANEQRLSRQLQGARKWYFDCGFRPLATKAGGVSLGGDGARDPLVMDETAVIVLPAAPHSD